MVNVLISVLRTIKYGIQSIEDANVKLITSGINNRTVLLSSVQRDKREIIWEFVLIFVEEILKSSTTLDASVILIS